MCCVLVTYVSTSHVLVLHVYGSFFRCFNHRKYIKNISMDLSYSGHDEHISGYHKKLLDLRYKFETFIR